MLYASRTGTRRNLDALRRAGWRLLVSPAGCVRTEGFSYALDNGAWTSRHTKVFDEVKFLRAVDKLGRGADWVVVPDRVCDRQATLEMFDQWWPKLRGLGLLLLALQDGMTPADVRPLLRPGLGLFIGGGDRWKEDSARAWGAFAREHSLYLHMGRVNSVRRISICHEAGVHSVDGTSATRYAVNIPKLTHAGAQGALPGLQRSCSD
jgi:hypothetical protein